MVEPRPHELRQEDLEVGGVDRQPDGVAARLVRREAGVAGVREPLEPPPRRLVLGREVGGEPQVVGRVKGGELAEERADEGAGVLRVPDDGERAELPGGDRDRRELEVLVRVDELPGLLEEVGLVLDERVGPEVEPDAARERHVPRPHAHVEEVRVARPPLPQAPAADDQRPEPLRVGMHVLGGPPLRNLELPEALPLLGEVRAVPGHVLAAALLRAAALLHADPDEEHDREDGDAPGHDQEDHVPPDEGEADHAQAPDHGQQELEERPLGGLGDGRRRRDDDRVLGDRLGEDARRPVERRAARRVDRRFSGFLACSSRHGAAADLERSARLPGIPRIAPGYSSVSALPRRRTSAAVSASPSVPPGLMRSVVSSSHPSASSRPVRRTNEVPSGGSEWATCVTDV